MSEVYDEKIKAACNKYFQDTDWRLLKAQLRAESNFVPNAVSQVGAMGIAQFMPQTWEEVSDKMRLSAYSPTAFMPEYAIPACAFYMNSLHEQWTAKREEIDRYMLTLASYNAGLGNILKAQRLADNASDYSSIMSKLHKVTGDDNARQTREYAPKILGYWVGYCASGC